tara:strand:+ start:76 stop:258 length:183 start_codon:yes stop_codon:yes gene_type:complete
MPPLAPTAPMLPTPPIAADIPLLPVENYLIVLGLFESLPDTFGEFPLSRTIPPLIPMIAF